MAGEGTGDEGPVTIESLPRDILADILRHAGYPHRHRAASTSRAFADAASHPSFTRVVRKGETITDACKDAGVGDTVIIPPGIRDECVVFDKPLALVGERIDAVECAGGAGSSRCAVVLEHPGKTCVRYTNKGRPYEDDERFRLANICFRAGGDEYEYDDDEHTSYLDFGVIFTHSPTKVRMDRCESRGTQCIVINSGRFIMEGCHVSGAGMVHTLTERTKRQRQLEPNPLLAAVYAEDLRGDLIMRGCVVSENASPGIHVGKRANFKAENCDVSYNGGHGIILHPGEGYLYKLEVRRCTIWRNKKFPLQVSSGDVSGITLVENHVQNRYGDTESDEDYSE
tara:strand:- start:247 stop:1269 length:1023 start_codon:yes stop_codon:yes gene_type:complete